MSFATKGTSFGDCIFNVHEQVYEPAEDSFLFAENLDVKDGERVLDLGTGCGLLGVLAAKKAGLALAVDVNPHAIRCAKKNSVLNGVSGKMDFVQASLFSALTKNESFDLILFNAPYLPSDAGEADSWIGRSWAGGATGREVVDRFISEVTEHLAPSGRVLLMQSTLTGVEETLQAFKKQGLTATVKAVRKLPFFEALTLIEAKGKAKKETN